MLTCARCALLFKGGFLVGTQSQEGFVADSWDANDYKSNSCEWCGIRYVLGRPKLRLLCREAITGGCGVLLRCPFGGNGG